jgi:hypothetical protein
VKHISVASLYGMLLALPTNNRPGWKGMKGANTLAYYAKLIIYGHKMIYNIGP